LVVISGSADFRNKGPERAPSPIIAAESKLTTKAVSSNGAPKATPDQNEMNLLELRKYAIDRRVEIRFGDFDAARECLINIKGQAQIPGEMKDFRVEEVFDAAEKFVIVSAGGARHLTREAMAKEIDEAWEKEGAGHTVEEED
jgi:hypothetical protein